MVLDDCTVENKWEITDLKKTLDELLDEHDPSVANFPEQYLLVNFLRRKPDFFRLTENENHVWVVCDWRKKSMILKSKRRPKNYQKQC